MRVFEHFNLCQLKVTIQLTSHGCMKEWSPTVTTAMEVDVRSVSHQQLGHFTEEREEREEEREKERGRRWKEGE